MTRGKTFGLLRSYTSVSVDRIERESRAHGSYDKSPDDERFAEPPLEPVTFVLRAGGSYGEPFVTKPGMFTHINVYPTNGPSCVNNIPSLRYIAAGMM